MARKIGNHLPETAHSKILFPYDINEGEPFSIPTANEVENCYEFGETEKSLYELCNGCAKAAEND